MLLKGSVVPDHDNFVAAVLQCLSCGTVPLGLSRAIVRRAVHEGAGAPEPFALVVEAGLHVDITSGAMLGQVRQPEAMLRKVVEELTLKSEAQSVRWRSQW